MQRENPSQRALVPVLSLFFLSGALGLIYEVVWSRMMMHVFGSTALAVGTVLAAFMSGLAVGAWLIGKYADQSSNCLRLYAWLEIGIAVTALVSHLLLSRLGAAHQALYVLSGSSDVLFAMIRFLLAFVLVMAPTVLMGATLPVLTRFLAMRRILAGVNLSTLYAINTFGAVCGVLLAGFVLIGQFGVHVPVYLAVTGNFVIGVVAWIMAGRFPYSAENSARTADELLEQHAPADPGAGPGSMTYRVILFGLGLSGMTSFAYEIYWTRSLVFILGNSTYALTTMLSAFLSGIALGGFLVRFILPRVRDRAAVFGWVQVLLGIFSALALPLLFAADDPQSLSQFFFRISSQAIPLVFTGYAVAFMVMLVPATLIGATFPLVGQIAIRDYRRTGTATGRIYAINTVGNVVGALAPGLFLLAWLGIQKGILLMAALNIGLGFLVLLARALSTPGKMGWRLASLLVPVAAAMMLGQTPRQFQFPSVGEQESFHTLFYREGPLATTKVYLDPRTAEKHISVDGIVIGGTGYSEFKQLLLAHLPKLLLDDVSTELSVGVGSGILVGQSARHAGVKNITGVEIEPSVVEGAGWFEAENDRVLDNPKFRLVVDDIGSFLRTNSDRYQVISADEKTADEYASNGFSYSIEYYDLLRNHLAPGGLAMQWVPTTLPPRLYRMVLKTFSESFPHVQLWYFLPAHKRGPFNTILVGSNEPVQISPDRMRQKFSENKDAWKSLEPYGLTNAEAVLPHFIGDERVIRPAVEDSPVNSLEHPRYEFFYPWDFAREREKQFIANHELIIRMKREATPAFLSSLGTQPRDTLWLRQAIAAELRYLEGFQQFLEGMGLAEQYRVFDDALAVAPWNDSLRARIYAQYAYLASIARDPQERARRLQRARALYENR